MDDVTLTEFLLARIAEDESTARADAATTPGAAPPAPSGPLRAGASGTVGADASRILAECEAKRRVVLLAYEATGLDLTIDMERSTGARDRSGVALVGDRILAALALPYAWHADYDPAWAR